MTDPLELDGRTLAPEDVAAVARWGRPVAVSDPARERVRTARERVVEIVDAGEAVYGLNTGFGELVDQRIPADRIEELQTNLVRSHAAGTGEELDREAVRAMMVTRINALLVGKSGVRERVVDHLVTMVNEGIHPVVRSRGSLGASGDLAPLAHVALVLIGEGEADVDAADQQGATVDPDGTDEVGADAGDGDARRLSGGAALATAELDPLGLEPKEGLALINGTQLTVGLAALALVNAERAVRAADVTGALTTEVTMGTTASCDPAIHDSRPHDGQRESAANVRAVAGDSGIVESHRNCDRVQDAYSIRCLPQVHGAVRDAVAHLAAFPPDRLRRRGTGRPGQHRRAAGRPRAQPQHPGATPSAVPGGRRRRRVRADDPTVHRGGAGLRAPVAGPDRHGLDAGQRQPGGPRQHERDRRLRAAGVGRRRDAGPRDRAAGRRRGPRVRRRGDRARLGDGGGPPGAPGGRRAPGRRPAAVR